MGRKHHPHCPLLLTALCFLAARAAAAASPDAAAIADFTKSVTNLPPSWHAGADPCAGPFEGVSCDGGSGRVTAITLPRSSLAGTLPPSLASLSALKSLQLQGNALSGAVPSLAGLASLARIALDGNAFTSLPKDFLHDLPSLQYLSLDDLPLAPWSIPEAAAGSSSLETFSAANASVVGRFPDVLANLSSLRTLRLSYNSLSGTLPPGLAGLMTLESLQLNNQRSPEKMSGSIDVVASMKGLRLVWLQSNAFSGPIPDLSGLQLESFSVRDNQLTGVVPPSLTGMTSLRNVSLSNNNLQGPMPEFGTRVLVDLMDGNGFCMTKPRPCDPKVLTLLEVAGGLGYPNELAGSWTGNDPCSGWIGVSCNPMRKEVVMLNLANRNLSGTISPAVANLTELTKLVLANNHLTGAIPKALTTMQHLVLLDVTNNSLTGNVPKFKAFVDVEAEGNRFGGSGGDGGGGGSNGRSSTSGSAGGSRSKSSAGMIIGILIALIVAAVFVGLFLRHRRKRYVEKFRPVSTKSPPGEPEMMKIQVVGTNGNSNSNGAGPNELYSHGSSEGMSIANLFESQGMHLSIEALLKATNNFNEDCMLGRGGFGVVYKGELDGKLVAVKRSDSGTMGTKGQQEFMAEIDVLRKVRHRHLVALLGYCSHGNERLLVYEYMPGGTLRQHLCDLQQSGYTPLTWTQRMTIALDVARGMEYLHSLAQETFIHRDLKPSNILLDQDMRAKVSDFGLVKLAKDTDTSMMTRVAGTFGYLAPEYATTGKVTTKVDVYAYGVILMEMIAGRKVLDDSLPDDETHLVTIFRRNMLDKEKFRKFVDPTLDLSDEAWNSLMEVADLARHCTAREPYQRPDMCHCVNRLSSLIDQWKPTNMDDDEEGETSMGLNQQLEKWRSKEFTISDF